MNCNNCNKCKINQATFYKSENRLAPSCVCTDTYTHVNPVYEDLEFYHVKPIKELCKCERKKVLDEFNMFIDYNNKDLMEFKGEVENDLTNTNLKCEFFACESCIGFRYWISERMIRLSSK